MHEHVLLYKTEKNLLTLAALEMELGEFKPTSWPRIRFISSDVPFAFETPAVIYSYAEIVYIISVKNASTVCKRFKN